MDINMKRIVDKVKSFYSQQFEDGDFTEIERVFRDVNYLFNGNFPGYKPCDTEYHDLNHTLKATLIMVEILVGMCKEGLISRELFELGIIAVFLHDSGYIKEEADEHGTGAKYTFEHIERSVNFVYQYLSRKKYGHTLIAQVQNMIRCTGVAPDLKKIDFSSEQEKKVGYALSTADLVSQMADDNYVNKLSILFEEFKEAYEYEGGIKKLANEGIIVFYSLGELIEKTPDFCRHNLEQHLPFELDSVFEFIDSKRKKDLLFKIKRNIEIAEQWY